MATRFRPSARTLVLGLVGIGAVSVVRTLVLVGAGGEDGAMFFSDIGSAVIVLAAAFAMFMTAFAFAPGDRIRRQWMLAAAGVLCFGIGDMTWAWIEIGLGQEVPYPGLPDLFYLAEYAFLGTAIVMAALSYRHLIDVRPAIGFSVTAGVVLLGLLYLGLLQPYILSDAEISMGEKALSTFYPVADVALMFVPSLMIVLVVAKLGAGSLGWQWWFVGLGALILAASDAGYSWMASAQSYEGGALVDYGWMLAHVAFAVGASLSRDVLQPVGRTLRPAVEPAS